ncbi:hypothetical protein MMC32_006223 [Xylographa parallela]|nr:hypothetical protein [Xylographa parallela]
MLYASQLHAACNLAAARRSAEEAAAEKEKKAQKEKKDLEEQLNKEKNVEDALKKELEGEGKAIKKALEVEPAMPVDESRRPKAEPKVEPKPLEGKFKFRPL